MCWKRRGYSGQDDAGAAPVHRNGRPPAVRGGGEHLPQARPAAVAPHGPTRVRTTLNTSFALVVLEDTLTKGERSLVAAGEPAAVRRQRETFQTLLEGEALAAVEEATGRTVRVCMSDVAPDDGVAIELSLFESVSETGDVGVAETDASGRAAARGGAGP